MSAAKRSKMGDAAGMLGLDALGAAIPGSVPVQPAPVQPQPTPAPQPQRKLFDDEEVVERERMAVTTFRISERHWNALRRAALERAEKFGGKADASLIVRRLLDRWMEEQGE